MPIPPDLMTHIRKAQKLEKQRQHNSKDIYPLIEIYKQILERLQPNDEPALYATIQNNLGVAYSELPTGDRASNLALAIACYQQALRFRTPPKLNHSSVVGPPVTWLNCTLSKKHGRRRCAPIVAR